MLNRASSYYIAVALAASACTGSGSDGIWMPSGGAGKADGFTTIKGSDIPSAYVDANKSYIINRKIANLTTVGALDTDETSLAKRVDGIIANMPADGAMHLAELVRMEDPTIHKSLFPGEQTALPKLWKLMEAPDSNDSIYGPKDNFGVLDSSNPPAAAVPPASLAISSLTTELQAPASRLENLYNDDNDTSTVTLADLASGVANPGSFTPAEVTAFASIQAVFRDKAVAQGDPKLDVSPGPGTFTHDATLGGASFHMTGTTTFDETRSLYYTTLTNSFTATQALASTVALPANAQLLVINQDSGAETVFGAGTVPSLPSGNYIYEMWQNGARSFDTNAELPVMTSTQTIPLNDKLDYALVSGLSPLVRNVAAATATYSGGYTTYAVHYTYDKTATPPPANAVQQAIQFTASPTVTIPVGRYSFPQQSTTFYVYANNVLWLSYGNSLYRMLPVGNYNGAPTRFQAQSVNATFDTTSNTLSCSQCGYPSGLNTTLKASMRDI